MSNKIRVMVVDDEPEVSRDCGEMLSAKGWAVETALSGKAGLARSQSASFDLIVLDLDMPGFAGTALLREFRGRAPGTPVIALIRQPSIAVAVQAMKAGACDCLARPFSAHELRDAAELALRARPGAARRDERPVTSRAASAEGLMIQTKPEACYACFGCLVACAYSNLGLPDDAPLRPEVLFAARLSVKAAGGYSVPLLCMQCADAPCISVCPTNALQRSNLRSPICADVNRCIGCRSCALACPIGVLSLDIHDRCVQKCDLCINRLRQGERPACVESCPMDALELVRVDAFMDESGETTARRRALRLDEARAGHSARDLASPAVAG